MPYELALQEKRVKKLGVLEEEEKGDTAKGRGNHIILSVLYDH